MNRRTFFAGLLALPAVVKAVVRAPHSQPVAQWAYNADSRGIHKLLQDCAKCVEPAPLDLDEIFNRIYALKRHRNEYPSELFVRNQYGHLIQIA